MTLVPSVSTPLSGRPNRPTPRFGAAAGAATALAPVAGIEDPVARFQKPIAILETPYKGEGLQHLTENRQYGRLALRDSMQLPRNDDSGGIGYATLAAHLLYGQVTNEADSADRELGMHTGFAFYPFAQKVLVYLDRGISAGMLEGINLAKALKLPIEYRRFFPEGGEPPSMFLTILQTAGAPSSAYKEALGTLKSFVVSEPKPDLFA